MMERQNKESKMHGKGYPQTTPALRNARKKSRGGHGASHLHERHYEEMKTKMRITTRRNEPEDAERGREGREKKEENWKMENEFSSSLFF